MFCFGTLKLIGFSINTFVQYERLEALDDEPEVIPDKWWLWFRSPYDAADRRCEEAPPEYDDDESNGSGVE